MQTDKSVKNINEGCVETEGGFMKLFHDAHAHTKLVHGGVLTVLFFTTLVATSDDTGGVHASVIERAGPQATSSTILCPPNACVAPIEASAEGKVAINPTVARTWHGNDYAAWQQLTKGTLAAGTFAIYGASFDLFNNRWQTPQNLSDATPGIGSGDAQSPQIALDRSGHGMTVWKQANGYDETSSTTVYNIVGRPYTLNWKRGEKLLEPANISLDHTANADLPNLKISACCQGLVAWQETGGTATVIWVSGKTSSFAQQHVESTETLSAGDATNQVSALRSSGGGSISLSSAPGTRLYLRRGRY